MVDSSDSSSADDSHDEKLDSPDGDSSRGDTPVRDNEASDDSRNGLEKRGMGEDLYSELHRIAEGVFKHQAGHTLQPTALVHEAYLKLAKHDTDRWKSRTHFLASAAQTMRKILIDYHRYRNAQKRGGGAERTTLSGLPLSQGLAEVDVVALDEALRTLEELDPRQGRVVQLKFFGGLTTQEIADHLEVSITTVEGDWRHARAWLLRELGC